MGQVVLVVAQDLHMSRGKVGAQCAHAAVGLYRVLQAKRTPWLHAWEVKVGPSPCACMIHLPLPGHQCMSELWTEFAW